MSFLQKVFLFTFSLPFYLTLQADAKGPNIVMIVADDMQACFGNYKLNGALTPNLDRLASEGVTFSKAFCQFPVCGPSRASFMSGLYPKTTKILGNNHQTYKQANPDLAHHPSLGEFLIQNGYYSARISKMFHLGVPGELEQGSPGADMPLCWDYTYNVTGPELYSPGLHDNLTPKTTHHGGSFYTVVVPDELAETQADAMGTTQAIAFLENRSRPWPPKSTNKTKLKPDYPFFLALGLVRPHVPLIAPKSCFDLYPLDKISLPHVPANDKADLPKSVIKKLKHSNMSITNQKKTIQAYYASVTYLDQQVGRVLNALDRLKIRDNTIVMFMSDHGYNLGEHTSWQKMSFWETTTKVPLIISSPSHKKSNGKVCESIIELIDIYPTLGDLTGNKNTLPQRLEGESLSKYLSNPNDSSSQQIAHTVMGKSAASIRVTDWRYSSYSDGEELYHLKSDPNEFSNLASNPEYQAQLKKMKDRLKQLQTSN